MNHLLFYPKRIHCLFVFKHQWVVIINKKKKIIIDILSDGVGRHTHPSLKPVKRAWFLYFSGIFWITVTELCVGLLIISNCFVCLLEMANFSQVLPSQKIGKKASCCRHTILSTPHLKNYQFLKFKVGNLFSVL